MTPTLTLRPRVRSWISISAVMLLIALAGCVNNEMDLSKESGDFESCHCYTFTLGIFGLDPQTISQISRDTPYAQARDFFGPRLMGYSFVTPNPLKPPQYARVDYAYVNKFILVFAEPKTSRIAGNIRQTADSLPGGIWIPGEEISRAFTAGKYDVYLFHNEELVVKTLHDLLE